MQKVAELAQLLIWTKSTNKLKWVKQWLVWLVCHWITLFSKLKKFCLLITLTLALTHLIQRFCSQITLFSAFSHRKHILVCLQLNWAVLGFMSQKATFYSFCCETTLLLALWHRKDVSVCLSLNLHCFQLYLTED